VCVRGYSLTNRSTQTQARAWAGGRETSSALCGVALVVKVAVVLLHGRQDVPSASKACVGTLAVRTLLRFMQKYASGGDGHRAGYLCEIGQNRPR
jgi:hypothetical protein